MTKKPEPQLTIKQRLFVEHYIVSLNATEAARYAGYSGDDRALAVVGSNNIRKIKIKEAIDARLKELTMSEFEVLGRLTAHARGDLGDLIDPATGMINWKDAKERGLTHLIKKVKQTVIMGDDEQTEIFEIELYDAQKALVHLGKVYGLFKEQVNVTLSWQQELEQAGIDAGNEFNKLVAQLASAITTSQD